MLDVNEKSIGSQTETLRASVGVMAPGNYVEANQKFQLQVAVDTAHLCTYE